MVISCLLSSHIDVHRTAVHWVEITRITVIVGSSVILQCNRSLAICPMAVSSDHGNDGHLGYRGTGLNVFKRVYNSDSLDLRPEVKSLALGLSETTGALLVGSGARTLTRFDILEPTPDVWLTQVRVHLRTHEFTSTTWSTPLTFTRQQCEECVDKYSYMCGCVCVCVRACVRACVLDTGRKVCTHCVTCMNVIATTHIPLKCSCYLVINSKLNWNSQSRPSCYTTATGFLSIVPWPDSEESPTMPTVTY